MRATSCRRLSGFGKIFGSRQRGLRDLLPGELDANAEVDAGIALQFDERAERHFRVGFGVDDNDHATAPLEKLVGAKIFQVAAVRDIDVPAVLAQVGDEFVQEVEADELAKS